MIRQSVNRFRKGFQRKLSRGKLPSLQRIIDGKIDRQEDSTLAIIVQHFACLRKLENIPD